jgi:hypothetical protein
MEVPFLTSLMGTITVVATYYWAGRPTPATPPKNVEKPATVPPASSSPPYWSNEWI